MPPAIPARSFFAFAFQCRYFTSPPVIDGVLKEWGDGFCVPDLMGMEGGKPFGEVSMGWDREGLYFGVRVEGKGRFHADPVKPSAGDCLHLWIDTRDVREARRASRYCHHLYFLPEGGDTRGSGPVAGQERISLARDHARTVDLSRVKVASRVERRQKRYTMEIALPAKVLTGYDPSVCSRIGFTYLLQDVALGVQSWSAGPDLPVAYDPSLWGTAELVQS